MHARLLSVSRFFPIGVRVTTSIDRQIAQELGVREDQVAAAVVLLDGGATVPFIARYRKESARRTRLSAELRPQPPRATA